MFGIFKRNPTSAIVVSLLMTVSLWAKSFYSPQQVVDDVPMMPLEYWLMQLVEFSPLVSTIAAFVFMYVLALMLIQLSSRHFFAPEQMYLPPFIFTLICSAFPMQQCMNGAYIAAFFVMLGLFQLFKVYRKERVFASIFLAAICISLASLFSAPAIFLLVLLPLALLLLRTPTEWRDWVIALSGAALPYLYAFVAYMYVDNDGFAIFGMLRECLFASSDWIFENGREVEWLYLAFLMFVVMLAVLMLTRGLLTSRVKVQKIHTLFVWAFFVMLVVMVLLPSGSMLLMPLMALPAGVLTANYLTLTRYRRVAGLLFYLLMLLTYATQYYDEVVEVFF
jgi:hypothetical protein